MGLHHVAGDDQPEPGAPLAGGALEGLEEAVAGRLGEPGEIAEAIVWLLSDQAGYTAGANIRVAGGRP